MVTAELSAGRVLIIAAEAREFSGLLRRIPSEPFGCPGARFARISGSRILLANGPGPRLVKQMLESPVLKESGVKAMISTGFCGALDPELRVGDVVTEGVWSEDRVAITAEEKRLLREKTGMRVVEMEYAAVAAVAAEWGVPCRAVKVVSDTAQEDLPLNFNLYRDPDGRFQLGRIAVAGLLRPFTVLPRLMQLDRNSRIAAEKLGEFFANSEF